MKLIELLRNKCFPNALDIHEYSNVWFVMNKFKGYSFKKAIIKRVSKFNIISSIIVRCILAFMRFSFFTTKWHFINFDLPEQYINASRSMLMALWHDRLMTAPCAWKWEKPLHVLASAHNDGRLIADIVEHLNMKPIYGSTGKCSGKTVNELIDLCNSNNCVAIIPDGPRGPRHEVAAGIASIAKITKTDIVLFTSCVKKFKKCKSWDQFIIAYPFNKGVIAFGGPITYNDIKDKTVQESCELIKNELDKLSVKAKLILDNM